ncbi:MAG: hypothetical protein QOD51_776, partial [Candidatus Eremiobacteraeota bacterium]|nr:hypothetical protein [Candidatus Eremiobacteraeota bacterium]
RAVEASSGQWTTPDAFAGVVHDPMSQKSFMWDNNNPYSYSDPTGFFPQIVSPAELDGSMKAPINGGAQPKAEVAKAGVGNSPPGVQVDVNNAIVTAYDYETAATTGSGKFKPGEMADIIANRLAGHPLNGGYDVEVTPGKDSARVSVGDPVSGYRAEITIHGRTTDVAIIYQGRVVTDYGMSYRWQSGFISRKGYLEYHTNNWPYAYWRPAVLQGPWGVG